MPVSVSVALCTFNGAAYLPMQLDSLQKQTVLPAELVVRDDGSTDGTLAVIEAFARTAPFPVRWDINPTRLGPAKNFEAAVRRCTGEVIAFCDQDDLWLPHKIGRITDAFADPATGAFFSDALMCDPDGTLLKYNLWSSTGLTSRLQRQWKRGNAMGVLLRQNVVTGATMAFARRFCPLVLPIDSTWMHDGWIALLIAATAPIAMCTDPLVVYRQHNAQAVGARRRSLYQQYCNARKMDRQVFAEQATAFTKIADRLRWFSGQEQLVSGPVRPVRADDLFRLSVKIEHSRVRSAIRLGQSSRLIPALRELVSLRYRRFSLGWKSFAQDLLL